MTATYTFDVFSSLDGYGAASGNWTGYWGKQGPELLDHRLAVYGAEQRMVFGANTYRQFARMLGPGTGKSGVGDPWVSRMRSLPTTVVLVPAEAAPPASTLPANTTLLPRFAEPVATQNILLAFAPLTSSICALEFTVSALAAWMIQTAFESPPASKVTVPPLAMLTAAAEVYTPDWSTIPDKSLTGTPARRPPASAIAAAKSVLAAAATPAASLA